MNTNPSDARKVPLVEQLERIPIDEVLRWTEQDGLCPSHSMPVGALAHTAAATIRNDRERISQLEQLVERKDEALRVMIAEWPERHDCDCRNCKQIRKARAALEGEVM